MRQNTAKDRTMSDVEYLSGPDSQPQPGVPEGKIEECVFTKSKIFPGTVRSYWVYVPAQYDATRPACVMVFQDGGSWARRECAPIVFDNLIHKKEMPVTIGIFISPGKPADSSETWRVHRSYEYDSLGDRYARFLLEEIFPEVEKKYRLAKDGGSRAISGMSSGAICAFNAAWERPDAFQRVFSMIGTYTGMRGGHVFPYLVRQTEPKPIRVFIEDGSKDMNICTGNWWLANQEMLSALEFSGYEVNHQWSEGVHSMAEGRKILPDVLRWLWKDYPAPIKAGVNSQQPVTKILSDENWQLIGGKHAGSMASNSSGEVFFAEAKEKRIHKISREGKMSLFAENTESADCLTFGPDGRLYASQPALKRIVAYDEKGACHIISEGIRANAISPTADGKIYVADSQKKRLWLLTPNGKKRTVERDVSAPSCICLTPDHRHLLVSDNDKPVAWLYRIRPSGSLSERTPHFHLNLPDAENGCAVRAIAEDDKGWFYFATPTGIQISPNNGIVVGTILKPRDAALEGIAFGGEKFDQLYASCGGTVYRRKLQISGLPSWEPPFTVEKDRPAW